MMNNEQRQTKRRRLLAAWDTLDDLRLIGMTREQHKTIADMLEVPIKIESNVEVEEKADTAMLGAPIKTEPEEAKAAKIESTRVVVPKSRWSMLPVELQSVVLGFNVNHRAMFASVLADIRSYGRARFCLVIEMEATPTHFVGRTLLPNQYVYLLSDIRARWMTVVCKQCRRLFAVGRAAGCDCPRPVTASIVKARHCPRWLDRTEPNCDRWRLDEYPLPGRR